MREIKINLKRPYTIYIDSNLDKLFNTMNEYKIKKNDTLFLITDDKVSGLYNDIILKFEKHFNIKKYFFNNGELNKNMTTIQGIYSFLIENNANRDSILIGLGGGVVGDLVGFVAATYMRGIRYINIPTTLLSQVDSSIGGKVGYNYNGIKNIVGSFYNPEFVFISTNFLKTLEKKQFIDGLGEVIKYSLIKDKTLLEYIKENIKGIAEKENDKMLYIIRSCLSIKKYFVEIDYKDTGIRNLLNFGHTTGHAIEITSNGKFTHGESVALGILVAIKMSENILDLSNEIYNDVEEVLKKLGLPIEYKVDNYNLFMYAINHDKKNGKKIRFVLLQDIGKGKIKVEVNNEDILKGIKQSIDKGE
ncbi:3-dehydroquinate synthase [Clostridium rectalis]|uniref:3-dehydroquinate synthase n=1 Tax=Clostridium rectalis TaxID=2040295 RepID=UPI000F635414|nr:3-dehydroquinate synthase [Clostridium rectalis]